MRSLPRLRPLPVHVADVLRLFRNIECIRGIHLHPVREFEGLHPRFELRIVGAFLLMIGVELLQQIELLPLLAERNVRVANVLDELLDLRVFRVDVGALIDARAETPTANFATPGSDSRRGTSR